MVVLFVFVFGFGSLQVRWVSDATAEVPRPAKPKRTNPETPSLNLHG